MLISLLSRLSTLWRCLLGRRNMDLHYFHMRSGHRSFVLLRGSWACNATCHFLHATLRLGWECPSKGDEDLVPTSCCSRCSLFTHDGLRRWHYSFSGPFFKRLLIWTLIVFLEDFNGHFLAHILIIGNFFFNLSFLNSLRLRRVFLMFHLRRSNLAILT